MGKMYVHSKFIYIIFIQWEFLPILQNSPKDKYTYLISINVGHNSSSEFDTDVFCVLYGEEGKTSPKTLADGKRKVRNQLKSILPKLKAKITLLGLIKQIPVI